LTVDLPLLGHQKLCNLKIFQLTLEQIFHHLYQFEFLEKEDEFLLILKMSVTNFIIIIVCTEDLFINIISDHNLKFKWLQDDTIPVLDMPYVY